MKSIGEKYREELNLTDIQENRLNSLYKEFLKEYIFPLSYPYNERKEKRALFRNILLLLDQEQLHICKERRVKPISLVNHIKQKRSNQLKKLENHYGSLNLETKHIKEICNIVNSVNKEKPSSRSKELVKQENIRQYLSTILEPNKLVLLKELHLQDNIESTKSSYRYLDINDEQAEKIWKSKIEMSKQKYRQWEKYEIEKALFRSILSKEQYDKFVEINSPALQKQFEEFKKRDKGRASSTKKLRDTIEYHKKNILPIRIELAKKIKFKSNSNDIVLIGQIKENYSRQVDHLIQDYRNYHINFLKDEMPLTLELIILSNSFLFVSPRSEILDKSLNLNNCDFSFKRDDEIWDDIKNINSRIRKYNLSKIEHKLDKVSYYNKIIVNHKRKNTYEDLYNAIVIDELLEDNIKKMEMRQITNYDQGMLPSSALPI